MAELLKATTAKAAAAESHGRIAEINSQNEKVRTSGVNVEMTLRGFRDGPWQGYLRNKGVKPSAVYGYESLLNRYVLPALGGMPLAEITPSRITEFLDGVARNRENKMGGPKNLNVYSLLRHMFEVATEYDLIPTNPVRKKLHRPKYKAKEKPALTPTQVGAILGKIAAEWYALVLAMILTSVRIGELIAIQWKDIDWMNAKLRLSKNVWRGRIQDSTKTGAVVMRYLPESLLTTLKAHRQKSKFVKPEDYVFSKMDGSLADPDYLRRSVLYPAMDKAGIDRGFRTHGFHIFRHTGGSIVRAQTGDMKLAQLQLSHAQMATTSDVYVHTDEGDLKKAAEALAGTMQQFLPPNLPTN